MDSFETTVVILCVILGIVLLGCLCHVYRRQNETRYSNVTDEELGKNKLWVGENPTDRLSNLQDASLLAPSTAQLAREEARNAEKLRRFNRSIANYCRSSAHELKIDHELPFIGTRLACKSSVVVHNAKVDRDYQGTYAVLLTQVSRGDITQADTCQFDWNSNKQRSKIAHFLTTLDHPSILNTVEVGFGLDSQNMFVQRWVSEEGSLRDALYEKGPFDSVFAKYPRSHLAAIEKGRPLRPGMIRQYGREILEGLLYFESVGLPYYNLHSGNVILVKGHVKLTDYENAFLGFKTRVHDSIKKLRSVDPQMAAFGAVLYEMCTGKQIPTAMNSKISLKVTAAYRDFQGLLDDIFTDPSLTFSQLSNHALFAAVTVKQPPIGNPASIAKKTKVKKLLRKASKHFVKDVYAGNKAKKRAKKVRKKSAIESKRQAEFDNDDYSSSSGDSFNEKSSSDDGGGLSEDSGDDSW